MREIKFRCYAKKSNKMWDAESFRNMGGFALLSGHSSQDFLVLPYPQEDYMLMQYTGLKDKNGVEVFEGDVVSYDLGIDGEKPENYKIIFDNKQCAYFLFPLRDGARLRHFTYSAQSNCEVIGNIYEHKHLLGGE